MGGGGGWGGVSRQQESLTENSGLSHKACKCWSKGWGKEKGGGGGSRQQESLTDRILEFSHQVASAGQKIWEGGGGIRE